MSHPPGLAPLVWVVAIAAGLAGAYLVWRTSLRPRGSDGASGLSPLVAPGRYAGTFNHYSLLRTLEDGLRVSGYVGYANDVRPIDTIWGP